MKPLKFCCSTKFYFCLLIQSHIWKASVNRVYLLKLQFCEMYERCLRWVWLTMKLTVLHSKQQHYLIQETNTANTIKDCTDYTIWIAMQFQLCYKKNTARSRELGRNSIISIIVIIIIIIIIMITIAIIIILTIIVIMKINNNIKTIIQYNTIEILILLKIIKTILKIVSNPRSKLVSLNQ